MKVLISLARVEWRFPLGGGNDNESGNALDFSWLFAAQNDVHEVTAFHVLQVSKASDADMLACPYLSRTLGLRSSQSLLREFFNALDPSTSLRMTHIRFKAFPVLQMDKVSVATTLAWA